MTDVETLELIEKYRLRYMEGALTLRQYLSLIFEIIDKQSSIRIT